MADDERTQKELTERAFLAGTYKPSKDLEEYLNENPELREKVLGDLEQRKLEIDTTLKEVERLQKLENNRLRNAKLALETVEAARSRAMRVGDERALQILDRRLEEASQAALPDLNIINQLTTMQNHALTLLRGDDIPEADDSIQLGGISYTPEQMQFYRDNPVQLQEAINLLQQEAEAGNTQSQQDAEALVNEFRDLLTEQGFRVEQERGFLPQAEEFVRERIAEPTQRVVENIRERLFGIQGKPSRVSAPGKPTSGREAVEASRREALRIRRAGTLRIRGTEIETE